uniref:uncharacterized protein LOC108950995 n=1 Tax=Ciona intestinalis TaxID=7719 RepID=UPI0002B8E206|nr:uncharacterized protein LOC108950995 [Ciona intestinalis]|eukprot:XP_026696221.1 uncharacterized protein LOC108950995 [Ciona intestinalis]
MAEAIKDSIESIFEEIGAAQAHCDVRIFCFSDEDQWIAYTSKEYKMAGILDCKHTFSFTWHDKQNSKTDLPNTVCMHIRKSKETDKSKNSVKEFWEGNVPYTSSKSGLVATLLTDTFRPTPELQKGFAYHIKLSDTKHFTIRGHEKNFKVQYRIIEENVNNLKKICKQKVESCTNLQSQFKSGFKHIQSALEEMGKHVGSSKISNSAKGNVARVYLDTQLKLEEDIISHSKRLLWSSPFFNVKAKKIKVLFILKVIKKFIKMLELVPEMEKAMKSNLQELNYCYEHLNINEKYQKLSDAWSSVNIRCTHSSGELQQIIVMLFNKCFLEAAKDTNQLEAAEDTNQLEAAEDTKQLEAAEDTKQLEAAEDTNQLEAAEDTNQLEAAEDTKQLEAAEDTNQLEAAEDTNQLEAAEDTKQLEAAIVYATALEQFHVASDATTVRVNEIKYNESHEKERVMYDKQLYLVITSSIMSLCQSNRTECEEFLRLLYFAAHHWNVRRSFGPTQEKSKHRTCLKSLMHFLQNTNRVVERLKSSSKTELRTQQLNELYENIISLGGELKETEKKFQDILSQLKPVKPIDNRNAMITNLEAQIIVSDNKLLPSEIQEKVKEFVKAQKNTTERIDSCRAKLERVVISCNGKHTGKYETLVSDSVNILRCFLSTQDYTDEQKKNITEFINQYKSDGTGIRNINIQKANNATKQAIDQLNNIDFMKEYEVGISEAALVHLRNAVATLNPDALQAVLGRLELIVPGLCGETEKAPEDKTEKVTCTELLDDLGTLDQNADVTVDENVCIFNRTYEQLQKMAMEKDMDKLKEASKHFSLDLVRRQWGHTQSPTQGCPFYFSFYCWNGDPIFEDPYYTANETHIPCPQMC